MSEITLTIDDKQISVDEGITVLQSAIEAGIYIPTLCYHRYLTPYGGCRICIVEIEGMRGFPTACTTPATDGMVVRTNTPQLQELRRGFLDLMLSKHPSACLACERKGECDPYRAPIRKVGVTTGCQFCPKNLRCELQEVVEYVGLNALRLPNRYRELKPDRRDPFFERDYNLCILCGRCVRVCQEIRGLGALAFTYRSSEALVGTAFGQSLQEAGCRFCGACVDICPTGALADRRRKWEGAAEHSVATTCPYCGVGCQLELEVREEKVIGVTPIDGVNRGQSCVRGRFGITEIVNHPKRLKVPLVRQSGKMTEASWDKALETVADRLGKYNGDEIAVISCAESTNEDNYILQKFARAVLGTNNIDSYARLCHTPTVTGLSRNLGYGAATSSIAGIQDADCIFAIGIDTGNSQPVLGVEIRRAVNNGAKLVVANPRSTVLCHTADLPLQYRPETDIALLSGIMKVIIDEGLADASFIEERCEGFDSLKESLASLDLEYVEKVTGVPRSQVMEAARMYATVRPACIIYGEGLTRQNHGSDSVSAIANLALLTGNIGKPSAGIIPAAGMNNVQGASDMGLTPDFYPGYQPVADDTVRQKFEAAWGVSLNPAPGLTLTEILDAIQQGKIKAAYIIGDDPVLHGRLESLDFLAVQAMFPSPPGRNADVVLPAASLTEKEGTFTNAERRIQLVRQAIEPIGSSKPDWWITCQIALKMGGKSFDYAEPREIMKEINANVPIYGSINYQQLENGGVQWPCTTDRPEGTAILYEDGFDGERARFTALEYKPPAEAVDADYPLILTGEPGLYYFNNGAMDAGLGAFSVLAGEAQVTVNPGDAAGQGITNGEIVQVVSKQGSIEAKAKVTGTLPAGVVGMPYHLMSGMINPDVDPVSKTPDYSACAVRLERKPQGE